MSLLKRKPYYEPQDPAALDLNMRQLAITDPSLFNKLLRLQPCWRETYFLRLRGMAWPQIAQLRPGSRQAFFQQITIHAIPIPKLPTKRRPSTILGVPKRPAPTPEVVAEVLRLRALNHTYTQIRQKTSVNRYQLNAILHQNNAIKSPRIRRWDKIPPHLQAETLTLWKGGSTPLNIATTLSLHITCVNRIIREAKLYIPSRIFRRPLPTLTPKEPHAHLEPQPEPQPQAPSPLAQPACP